MGGNGVCTGVMHEGARHLEAKADADGDTNDIGSWAASHGDDGGEWITSIDKCWIDPLRLCSKLLLLHAMSTFSSTMAAFSDSMHRLSAKLIRFRCTGLLAGTIV